MSSYFRELFRNVGLLSGLCLYVFGEVGFLSGSVRRGRVIFGMCLTRSAYCRDVFVEVGLVSRNVRRGRICVGKCSAWSA